MKTCHDCGVEEGELHGPGCDMERCPTCGIQAITCYQHCVNPGDGSFKPSFLINKRYPYIIAPVHCARCLEPWPDFFNVPDEEWDYYVPPDLRREVLCRPCYDLIVQWCDEVAE